MRRTESVIMVLVGVLCISPLCEGGVSDANAFASEMLRVEFSPCLSGKGDYIKTVTERGTDPNSEWKTTQTFERIWWDKDRARIEIWPVSPEEAKAQALDPNKMSTCDMAVIAGNVREYTKLTRYNDPIWGVKYNAFAVKGDIFLLLNDFASGIKMRRSWDNFEDMLRIGIQNGALLPQKTIVGKKAYLTLDAARDRQKYMERTMDMDKDMAILSSKTYFKGHLIEEITFDSHIESASGKWYPCKWTQMGRYSGGELTRRLTVEILPDTLELNVPIEPSVFPIQVPHGADADVVKVLSKPTQDTGAK